MEIRIGKEIVNKTTEDIPQLVQIIKTKEQVIRNLLAQEGTKNPLELRDKAHDVFKATKKEVLATLHILDQLGYTGKEGTERKIFKNGPFFTFNKTDYSSPKQTRRLKEVKKQQEEISKLKDIDRNELNKFLITI